MSLTSDAAVEHYQAWGAYGATKAALDHLTLTWAAEDGITAYAVDPGDMRTAMHQDAFPGEDISDRPLPRTVVPHLLALLDPAAALRALPGRRHRVVNGGCLRCGSLDEHPSTVFEAPELRAAPRPRSAGSPRDGVRLLVARPGRGSPTRGSATCPTSCAPGDLVVVNNSATIAGELDATGDGRGPVVLHVATPLDDGTWVVELRTAPDAARAGARRAAGRVVPDRPGRADPGRALPARRLVADRARQPALAGGRSRATWSGTWPARDARSPTATSTGRYPLSDYQSVFSALPGERGDAVGRRVRSPRRSVTDLVSRGVAVAPITLHTGVSSQEAGEAPQPERFVVPAATARLVNAVRAGGGRVVAVGTTVTRALESAVDDDGRVVARSGWTERVVTPADPPRVVTGLVTGWHDPQASHLLLVEAVAGPDADPACLRRRRRPAATSGTSSATPPCCCRENYKGWGHR